MPKLRRETMGHDGWESPAGTGGALEFGRFRVLVRPRRLFAGGVGVELGARAFDMLMVLIEAGGALVTNDEMQSRVWSGVVVARENLKVQISALRKALGEDRELIRTENGRGYRFTAAVRVTAAAWECLSTRRAAKPQNGRNAVLPADLSVIASRLTRLEVGLVEALNFLGNHRNNSRRHRPRYYVGHSSRRTRRRRQRATALHERPLDLIC